MDRTAALDLGSDGELIGRDPRSLAQSDLLSIGHRAMSAQQALRLRCIDCCSGSVGEVRKCAAVACPSWPFRMGKSPWKQKRTISAEQIAKMQAARNGT